MPTTVEPYIKLMESGRYKVFVHRRGQKSLTRTVDTLHEARKVRDEFLAVLDRRVAQAAAKEAAAVNRTKSGDTLTLARVVPDYLAHRQHLVTHRKSLAEATVDGERRRIPLYLIPHLGDVPIDEISPTRINDVRVRLEESGGKGGKPLGQKTIKQIRTDLQNIFKYLVAKGLADANPVKESEPVTIRRDADPNHYAKTGRVKFLSKDEAELLVQHMIEVDHDLLNFVRFNLIMGLRPQEIVPLRWSRIDFGKKTVDVREFAKFKNGKVQSIGPVGKTVNSPRTLRFGPVLEDILKDQWSRRHRSSDLVFPSRAGTYHELTNLRNRLGRACEKANISAIHTYGLRHSAASYMLQNQIPPKIAAERMGHSSTKEFFDTYSHVTIDQHDQAVDKLELGFDLGVPHGKPGLRSVS